MSTKKLLKDVDEVVTAARIAGFKSPDEWYNAFVEEYHKLPKLEQRDGHIFLKLARKAAGIDGRTRV